MTDLIETVVQYPNPADKTGTPDIEFLVEWEYTPAQIETLTDPGYEAECCLISIGLDVGGALHDVTELLTACAQDDIFELAMAPE